jgi:hypothetical protein
MDFDTPAPEAIPSKRGGIRFEWHAGDRDLEITVTSDAAEVFFADDEVGVNWEGDLFQLLEPIRNALLTFGQ